MSSILCDRLRQHAREQPDGPAVRTASLTWSWRELGAHAETVRGALTGLGVAQGQVVAIALPNGPELVASLLGVALAGGVPGLVDLQDPGSVAATLQVLQPAVVVATWNGAPNGSEGRAELAVRATAAGLEVEPRPADGSQKEPASLADGACIVFTSGTTAEPKGVVWSQKRLRALLDLFPTPPRHRAHPCLGVLRPMSRAAGFFPTVRAVFWGIPLAIIDSPFALGPAFRAIGQLGVTWFSCTPAQVDLLLQAAPAVPPQLTSVVVSGAPIAPATLVALADYLQGVSVSASYGLAEVGIVTSLGGDELRRRPDSCGRIASGRVLSIVGESGETLPRGTVGQITIQLADWTAEDGYWRCDPAVSARFVDGLLHTNDRGYVDEHGLVVLTERTAEVIKVAGRAVSAPSIEATLRGVDAHLSLTVVGVPHPRYGEVPAVVFEPRNEQVPAEQSPSEQALRQAARQHLRSHELPRWFLAQRRLPRTSTGKVHRKLIEAQARQWVGLWPDTLAWAGRFWPARPLSGEETLAGLCAMDGVPDDWREVLAMGQPDPAARDVAAARAISSRYVVPVGWAKVLDGVDAYTCGVRIVDGPWLVPEYRRQGVEALWLPHLLACASSLPGPPPVATVVRPTDSVQTALLSPLGFAPVSPGERLWARMPPPPDVGTSQRSTNESTAPMDITCMLEDDRIAAVVRELA